MNGNAISRMLATVALALSATLALAESAALLPTLMPECNLALFVNLEKMRTAPIFESFKAFENLRNQLGTSANLNGMDDFQTAMREISGLEDKDFIALSGGANLTGVDIGGRRQPPWHRLDAVLGLQLGKSLSDDQLERNLKTFAQKIAEQQGLATAPTVFRANHRGSTLFHSAVPDESDERIYFAMAGDGQVFLIGSEKGVTGALDRWRSAARQPAGDLFPATVGGPVARKDMYVLFKPTAEMMAKMKAEAATAGQTPGAGPAAMAQQAFAQMTALALGVDAGATIDVALFGDFGSQQIAQQIKILLDNQVVSGIRMFGTMMSGGKPLPMLQTLKTDAAPNGAASLSLAISQQDVKTVLQSIETREQ